MTFVIYDDVMTMRLVREACKMLDLPSEAVLKLFGEYFFSFCKMAGYDTMLHMLGGNLVEFIENLDSLHSYLALSYQEMNAPSFHVEKRDDGRMLLHYYSDWKSLYHIVPGIVSAVAKGLFDTEVSMTILNQSHVVFLISQSIRGLKRDFCHERGINELWIEEQAFCNAFPFHIVFGKDVRPSLQLTNNGTSHYLGCCQMVWMETLGCMMYLCYPKLRSLQELEEKGLHISDMARHDTNQDLILLNQQRLELGILSLHLEAERKKTETLLYAMLPRHVANQLKEGKKVEAGMLFQVCTILFSDVVTFTNIQNVNMLNSMYSKFDCLTSVHDVYKVETIGDAYMVVGGVPIPADSHAERVANFALGMHIAARKVSNPVTGQRIQVTSETKLSVCALNVSVRAQCVCGHSMCAPGPDSSRSAHRPSALEDKGFEIMERGQIQVKGKGTMKEEEEERGCNWVYSNAS
uniref:guanylate cyclase n=1 Tax=Esox lucius TaxID=8010 RepID=A0A3P8XGH8_ESOLU